jgi:autotransporter-associated beta strand protein
LTVNNGIAGSGSLTNNGSGVVTIGGANTYEGTVMIAQGTLRAGSGTALGDITAGTIVANGATLDTGGQTLNNEPDFRAPASAAHAIVNNVVMTPPTAWATSRWKVIPPWRRALGHPRRRPC